MRITTNYESPLVLKNIMITDGIFKRTEDSLENVELRVNVAHNIEQLSEVEYKITLELSVADPEGKLSVFVKGMAVFETEQENKIKEERDSKIRKLKELAERTYTLRRNFVKDFTLNEKATSKHLQNFIITALLEDNYFDIEKFIEMLDVEYDEDDLDEMQGVREVYERSNKTLQNKMVIAGYVLYNDRKTNDCYDYTGNHRENESLQRLYDGLITIGYEMSDEELAMMDGTHELYTTEDE